MKTPIKSHFKNANVADLKARAAHEKRGAEAKLKVEAVAEFRKQSVLHSKGSAYRLVTEMFRARGLAISPGSLFRWNKDFREHGHPRHVQYLTRRRRS